MGQDNRWTKTKAKQMQHWARKANQEQDDQVIERPCFLNNKTFQ
jgi:hypothetical protein